MGILERSGEKKGGGANSAQAARPSPSTARAHLAHGEKHRRNGRRRGGRTGSVIDGSRLGGSARRATLAQGKKNPLPDQPGGGQANGRGAGGGGGGNDSVTRRPKTSCDPPRASCARGHGHVDPVIHVVCRSSAHLPREGVRGLG